MHDADDMAVLDGTRDGLQESTDLLSHYAAYAGSKINSRKTKTMAVSKQSTQGPYTETHVLSTLRSLWNKSAILRTWELPFPLMEPWIKIRIVGSARHRAPSAGQVV